MNNCIGWAIGQTLCNEYRSVGILTLGELITGLKECPQDSPVFFENQERIGRFHSWRGSYESLSLSDDEEGPTTVGELLAEAESCVGRGFGGYKGGTFTMNIDSQIHRANWGSCGTLFLSGIAVRDGFVEIICSEDDL